MYGNQDVLLLVEMINSEMLFNTNCSKTLELLREKAMERRTCPTRSAYPERCFGIYSQSQMHLWTDGWKQGKIGVEVVDCEFI